MKTINQIILLTFTDACPVRECRVAFVERKDLQILQSAMAAAILFFFLLWERWQLYHKGSTQHALRAMREMAAQWHEPFFSKIWLHHHV